MGIRYAPLSNTMWRSGEHILDRRQRVCVRCHFGSPTLKDRSAHTVIIELFIYEVDSILQKQLFNFT